MQPPCGTQEVFARKQLLRFSANLPVALEQSAIDSKELNVRVNRKNRHRQRNLLLNYYQTERVGPEGLIRGD